MYLLRFYLLCLFVFQEVRALIEEIENKIAETIEAKQDEQQVVKKATQASSTKAPAKKGEELYAV